MAEAWLMDRFDHKALVMGFGHASTRRRLARADDEEIRRDHGRGGGRQALDEHLRGAGAVMLERKNIHPNLDFPAGPPTT
jgi:2-methylcitrate synthase